MLLAIDRLGAKPIYRLGESIDHSIFKRYARPPKDFEKWTRICVNIIRHYNEGWAGGFTLGISYWEIWNEPDLGNEMWDGGTAQQYRDLYKTAVAGIKALDPSLKVGGCALAGVLDFAEDFFRQCAREAIPLDFFSFHLYYRRMEQLESYVTAIDRLLAKYGLSHVERIFDEWNYFGSDDMPDLELWRAIRDAERGLVAKSLFETAQSEIGASFAAASMIEMNRLPVDIATYYDGQPKLRYCGLFDRYAVPQKTYHAFRAYGPAVPARRPDSRNPGAGRGPVRLGGRWGEKERDIDQQLRRRKRLLYRGHEKAPSGQAHQGRAVSAEP